MEKSSPNFLVGLGKVYPLIAIVTSLVSLGIGIYDTIMKEKYRKAKLEAIKNAGSPVKATNLDDKDDDE